MTGEADIVILKGAPASGKSQTAKSLTRFFPKGVKIEVDILRQMVISVDWKNQAEHINLLQVAAGLAYDFHQLNFKPVVMVDTFSGDKIIKFLSTLKQLDTSLRIRTFSLYASDDVLKKRLDGRPAGEFKDFEISRKLNLDVLKNTVDDEHLIDTSCLLPAQTAELIYREISGSK